MATPDLPVTLPAEKEELPLLPERGASIGRYLVLEPLGMGGSGVVFSVYDPQLDRKVALKLLRGDKRGRDSTLGRARLVREAQAMARVSHPNVLHVYEVGFADGIPYVVMEQVEGRTLRAWMAKEGRPWQAILDMLRAAGAGLAAAHQAGVVHQDFKPENVLVGTDGRPRVSDFGLAGESKPGAGTRSYMSPEQKAGESVDARSDQYAYCITVWEALQRERPPTNSPLPAEKRAPSWIFRVLARGLAERREDRWPSMEALLARLDRGARLGTRMLLGLGAAAAAIGLIAFFVGREAAAPQTCSGAAARLADVWDASRQGQVRAAFAATGLPYSDAAFRVVRARIGEYARGWAAMHEEACRATRVEGRQSDTLLDVRMACLERRRAVLGRLTDLWARGMDAEMLEASADAAARLPPLPECADARALTERAPLPADPAVTEKIARVRGQLDAAQALLLAHRGPEAKKVAVAARAEADATGWAQVRAEAAFAEGEATAMLAEPQAEAPLLEAARLGGTARDDRLAARALIVLADHIAEHQRHAKRALLAADIAAGVLARAGDDPGLRVELLLARGRALLTGGRAAEAREVFTRARAEATALYGATHRVAAEVVGELARVAESLGEYAAARLLAEENLMAKVAALGEEHPRVAAQLNNLGMLMMDIGDRDAAARYYRRALAIKEKVVGPDAPTTALTLNNLGIVETSRRNLEVAERLLERALALREKALGLEHPYVASTLGNLAALRRKQGRHAEALALLERALAVKTKAYGPEHRNVANSLSGIGYTLHLLGDSAGALRYHRRALEVREKVLGPQHVRTLTTKASFAATLADLGRCAEALPLVAAVVAGLTKVLGAESPQSVEALVTLGRCELERGQRARALATLQRALAVVDKAKAVSEERGPTRWWLALALWATGQRPEALTAARQAEQELAGDGEVARLHAAVRAWLAARPR